MFKNRDRIDLKITEELVFRTPALRYTQKSLIRTCKVAENGLWLKKKMDFERGVDAQIQYICLKF